MADKKRMQFSINITAPVEAVFKTMLAPESYNDWTSAFAEGSYYEGSWRQGEKIKFLTPSGEGMVAEVAECRENEFVSLRHIGLVKNGEEDTTSESVRAWAPAYENYTFTAIAEGTQLVIDQDVTEDFEAFITQAWPNALQRLKNLCEKNKTV
jgi:hypothetical protein